MINSSWKAIKSPDPLVLWYSQLILTVPVVSKFVIYMFCALCPGACRVSISIADQIVSLIIRPEFSNLFNLQISRRNNLWYNFSTVYLLIRHMRLRLFTVNNKGPRRAGHDTPIWTSICSTYYSFGRWRFSCRKLLRQATATAGRSDLSKNQFSTWKYYTTEKK